MQPDRMGLFAGDDIQLPAEGENLEVFFVRGQAGDAE